ncbi:MAG TPA: ATP-dependent RNA helicase HrpA [Burkholderiaceae bacterium]|nr:ATP-dependent RNA helicase HrpA [Burkholderiaceae bacterium]
MHKRTDRPAPARAPTLRPLPPLQFPESLPVSARRDDIARAIAAHPVVIVSGETGSGKTTQLPKICALAGRGQAGLIGHTQPRRLAATTVARRIAEELGSPLGTHVGYKIRFNEQLAPGAPIKLMTDGILLAETLSDPQLRVYDTLIVDEAHERSLNIDFLLGYLQQLLRGPRRDDLKVVITSATIDAERFAAHFASDRGPAPVIEVSGRLYPVQIRYRDPAATATGTGAGEHAEPDDGDETDLPSQIEDAIDELWRERPGDVLVFLPGEREIRDVAEHLRRAQVRAMARRGAALGRGEVEILPLYSRLSAADQERVFSASSGRRIVLATNVAETSLTVPGIRYVVDPGLARIKRYRYRGKVEQLQIEPISQAAANQRAGRCGRVSDGVCIRLYSETDLAARPRFTDPEVLRSSLAAVILRMRALNLADVESFPFLDPPPRRAIVDGYALLQELNAVDEARGLTDVGRQLARLPTDPRIGRMLLAAHDGHCLREMLIIAAALSSQDPRERPMTAQQAADQQHRRFVDEQSDFLSLVKVWDYWQKAVAERAVNGESNRRLAARLEREFLSTRKLREWADVHGQLREAVAELRWQTNDAPAGYEQLHRALLAGLLGNLGTREPEDAQYSGTHATRFVIHPSSGLTRKPPRWLMAAEMVDTGRLLARTVARIDPLWIERVGAHLIARSYSEPAWSKKAGEVVAFERGVLYGLTIYAQRRVMFGHRDPRLARELLIREGLVNGDWLTAPDDGHLPFLAHNRRLIADIEKLEHKIRRPDLLVDPQFLFDWFDARLPEQVWSGRQLEAWYRKASPAEREALKLTREELLRKDSEGITSEAFPRRIAMRGIEFELDYHFDPGASDDGVTLTVPLYALNQVDAVRAEWLVPGMLADKVQACVKSLPQKLRRHLVPLPAYAEAFVGRWRERVGSKPLVEALIDDIGATGSTRPAPADFKLEQVPPHLFMNFRLVDRHGRQLGLSRHLAQLRAEHGGQAQSAFRQALSALVPGAARDEGAPAGPVPDGAAPAPRVDRGSGAGAGTGPAAAEDPGADTLRQAGPHYTTWSFGELPELMELTSRAGGAEQVLIGYPALIDRGDAVELQVFDEPEQAQTAHRAGLKRLFALALREPLRHFERNIPDATRLALLYSSLGSAEELRADLVDAVLERACFADPLPADRAAFEQRVDEARPRLNLIGQELARSALAILIEHAAVQKKLTAAKGFPAAHADIEQQLAALLPKRFLIGTPAAQLNHLPRYLKAVAMRLDKLKGDPARDAARQAEMAPLQQGYRRALAGRKGHRDARLEDFRWALEELRVSLFAQELRTPMPVSVKRLQRSWDALMR